MVEISKQDWKIFREKLAQWQERYMEKLVQEYIALLQKNEDASDKFWELDKRIKKDRKHPGVILELRKSNMIFDIAFLLRDGVIQLEDLDGFSAKLIGQIRLVAKM